MDDYSGQWIGQNEGPNAGTVILDLDNLGEEVAGHFFLFERADAVAGTFGELRFPRRRLPGRLKIPVSPFHAHWGRMVTPDEFRSEFPNYDFPTEADIHFTEVDGAVVAKWRSSIHTSGKVTLRKGNDRTSSLVQGNPQVLNWSTFREYVSALTPEEFVFRGQSTPWPLRTSFHRTSRSDLVPFIQRDIPKLYNQLSGRLKHLYNLSDPKMNASFWALAQHHGYPTPLLDWTLSPFVAAYFAYENVSPRRTEGAVRIFLLNRKRWEDSHQPFYMTHSYPLLCLLEPFSLENDRSIPQQSVMMVSNIDDIEDYIRWHEAKEGQTYLQAIDLPISDRVTALQELRLMGIGAGSLFPGIDGTCRDFKERYFPEY